MKNTTSSHVLLVLRSFEEAGGAASSSPPVMAVAAGVKLWERDPRACSFCAFFFLSLIGIFLFSKRSLEPAVSSFTDTLLLSTLPKPSLIQASEIQSNGVDSRLETPPADSDSLSPSHSHEVSEIAGSSVPRIQIVDGEENSEEVAKSGENEHVRTIEGEGKCDLFDGNWVEDEEGWYPLYRPGSCPYVDDAFTCQENGRPDNAYLKWRWKPHGCDLPRFNGTDFLERLRGKRLMLVGDSMNRNQFESLLCLLRESLANKSRMYETRGYPLSKGRGYFIFRFVDYNCTVEFSRSHFLVREGKHLTSQGKSRPSLLIDHIDRTSSRWKRADVLIFNTGHWWAHGKTSKGKDFYQEGAMVYPKFDPTEAFNRAMRTWAHWVDQNMLPHKNLVIFRGYSMAHFRGGDWDSGGTCKGESQPIIGGGHTMVNAYPPKMRVIEEVLNGMEFPVVLLNVTRLTSFRKDGHPSVYRVNRVKKVIGRESTRRQDCSHWCLPGVPDTWNELIYAAVRSWEGQRSARFADERRD